MPGLHPEEFNHQGHEEHEARDVSLDPLCLYCAPNYMVRDVSRRGAGLALLCDRCVFVVKKISGLAWVARNGGFSRSGQAIRIRDAVSSLNPASNNFSGLAIALTCEF
jgi:hypothetical protein